jgi:hypothetical protein
MPLGDREGVCDVCGTPAAARCARCRGVWYCGPKCQRAAWAAHKLVCVARGLDAAAAGSGASGGSAAGCSTNASANITAHSEASCGAGCDGGPDSSSSSSGGLDDNETLRDIAGAVASLASGDYLSGFSTLFDIGEATHVGNRKRYEFQSAVAAAGGIPLLVRGLVSRRGGCAGQTLGAYILQLLAVFNPDIRRAIAAAG